MPSIVTFNGVNYAIPLAGEVGWGDQVNAFLVAVANNAIVAGQTVSSLTITSETVSKAILAEVNVAVAAGDTLAPSATNIILTALTPVALSATTAIADGTTDGQLLTLTGTSDVNTVSIQSGANTLLNGDVILGDGEIITLKWDTTLKWVETYRSI